MVSKVLLSIMLLSGPAFAQSPLSEHFNKEEFNQKHDPLPPCSYEVSPELVKKLEQLRFVVGSPIIITSGFRSEDYNKKVGGARHSQHMNGKAADIHVNGMSSDRLADFARTVGFTFVKVYKHHVHVDVR